MKQRRSPMLSFVLMLTCVLLVGVFANTTFLNSQHIVRAQTGPTRSIKTISITADSFEDLGNGWTRARGSIRLGDNLFVEGLMASVDFSSSELRGQGTLVLAWATTDSEGVTTIPKASRVPLWKGEFYANAGDASRGWVRPGEEGTALQETVAGFEVDEALAISHIDTRSSTVYGQAELDLPLSQSDLNFASRMQTTADEPLPCGYSEAVATMSVQSLADGVSANAEVTITPSEDGPTYGGTLQPFSLPDGGISLNADHALITNDGITIPEAALGSSLLFGERSTTIRQVTITPQAVNLPSATVSMPDICFEGDCSTSPIKITNITAERKTSGKTIYYDAAGTLNINLPGNSQTKDITFTTNDTHGNGLAGTVDQLALTVANNTLTLQDLSLSFAGLVSTKTLMQLPDSLGGRMINSGEIGMSKNGMAFCVDNITIPGMNFGSDRSPVQIPQPTLTLRPESAGYAMDFGGLLEIDLPGNHKSVEVGGEVTTDGQWNGTVDNLSLDVAGGTLTFDSPTISKSGISGEAKLGLADSMSPASSFAVASNRANGVGLMSVSFDKVTLGKGGLKTTWDPKDNLKPDEFKLPNLGYGQNVSINQAVGKLLTRGDAYFLRIEGEIVVSLPGNKPKTKTTVEVDGDGKLNAKIANDISLKIAGSTLSISKFSFIEGGMFADEASLELPKAFGGTKAVIEDITIDDSGLTIGKGALVLPDIKIGDGSKIKILAPTASIESSGGVYQMSLEGTLKITLPGNDHTIKIKATIDSNGKLKATVASLNLNINGMTLTMKQMTLSSDGLKAVLGQLKLPATLGGITEKSTTSLSTGMG